MQDQTENRLIAMPDYILVKLQNLKDKKNILKDSSIHIYIHKHMYVHM